VLGYPEGEVWRMTPYKLLQLFKVHKRFHPDRFKPEKPDDMDDIDYALGGL